MESIIAVDMKSFPVSNNLISDIRFGFRQGHSTLDMLMLLTKQWMEALNVRHEIRAVSLDISHAFDTVWHPALLSKLSASGIRTQLHTWFTDFLSSHSQCVALNGILLSPLHVKAGVPSRQCTVPVLFLIFISDLSGKSSLSIC